MNIRITGLPAEVDQAVKALHQTAAFDVIDVSDPYPNRKRAVRRDENCPDCGVPPGGSHTPECAARDSGQETWPGSRLYAWPGYRSGPELRGTSRLVRVYIQVQLHPGGGAVP